MDFSGIEGKMTRKSISIGWTSYHLTVILIVTLILFKQASQLPIDDDTDKRTGHNIMRFGRTTGHNILRFGRTPGHNIMRFGKREESNSAPGSSYEVSETKPLADLASRYSNLLDQLSEEGGPSSSGSSNLYDTSSSSASQGSSPLMYGYYGQPLPLNALYVKRRSLLGPRLLIPHLFLSSFYNQRGQPVLPYQQAKKGRPETDHVIMRFG